MEWLRRLFHRCEHKWVIKDKYWLHRGKEQVGALYVMQCEKCGDITKRNTLA